MTRHSRRRLGGILLGVVSILDPGLLAQTLVVTIPPATPFSVSWRHDGLGMPEFRWWCDGAIVKNFPITISGVLQPDGVNYLYTEQVPGLAVGTHPCFISAFNENGETKAPPIPVVVKVPTPPSMPFDIRVVITVRGGQEH